MSINAYALRLRLTHEPDAPTVDMICDARFSWDIRTGRADISLRPFHPDTPRLDPLVPFLDAARPWVEQMADLEAVLKPDGRVGTWWTLEAWEPYRPATMPGGGLIPGQEDFLGKFAYVITHRLGITGADVKVPAGAPTVVSLWGAMEPQTGGDEILAATIAATCPPVEEALARPVG